jgi:hypothetical protein
MSLLLVLAPQRVKRDVLQTYDLALEQSQIDEQAAAVILALDFVHARTGDLEDRHSPAVRPAHKGALDLAAAHESQSSQEKVVCLKHLPPPPGKGPRLSPKRRPRRDRSRRLVERGDLS